MNNVTIIFALLMGFAFTASAGHNDNRVCSSNKSTYYQSGSKKYTRYNNHNSYNHRNNYNNRHNNYRNQQSSGYYETISQRVWIAGRCEKIWVPARYENRRMSCGSFRRVLICAGHYETRQSSGHYEYRNTRVWRSAPSSCSTGTRSYRR